MNFVKPLPTGFGCCTLNTKGRVMTCLEIKLTAGNDALASHRVSFAAFKDALGSLLAAVHEAARQAHKDTHGTRLPFNAKEIDLELEEIRPNCATLKFAVTRRSEHGESTGTQSILDLTAERVANDIHLAASGNETRNAKAVVVARALPMGTVATLVAIGSSGSRKSFEITRTQAADTLSSKETPVLKNGTGKIIALCMKEGRESVTFLTGGRELVTTGTPDIVRRARTLPDGDVQFSAVGTGSCWRLIRVREATEEKRLEPSVADSWAYLTTRWNKTLELLAQ